MLNKQVCMKCYSDEYTREPWNHDDEYDWTHGKKLSFCCGGRGRNVYTNKEPPKYCPYILEHMMTETQETC